MSWKWPWGKNKKCGTCDNDLDENHGEILLAYGNPPGQGQSGKQIKKVKICSSCAESLEQTSKLMEQMKE